MALRRLIVVRHGNTFAEGEVPLRIGARSNPDLTMEGRAQASRLGRFISAEGIVVDRIRSGPLARAQASAAIIAETLATPPPVTTASWLNEVDYGADDGQPETAVVARVGIDALEEWDRSGKPAPGWPIDPTGLRHQITIGLSQMEAGTTMLVTSNGLARFVAIALGLAGLRPSWKLRTGAMGEIIVGEAGASLIRWDTRPLATN